MNSARARLPELRLTKSRMRSHGAEKIEHLSHYRRGRVGQGQGTIPNQLFVRSSSEAVLGVPLMSVWEYAQSVTDVEQCSV